MSESRSNKLAARIRTRIDRVLLQRRYARSVGRGPTTPKSIGRRLQPFEVVRARIAAKWLGGAGIEIGALHQPLVVPAGASVTYVDRMTTARLRDHYPELSDWRLVEPDVIDDGEHLTTFADASLDFVIANHFIEHCEDPIGSIETMLRVVRPSGVVYLAAPDMQKTFDRDRTGTPFEHLVRDHQLGPALSREQHYEEWARIVERAADPVARGKQLSELNYSIHFHVWTATSFKEFLGRSRRYIGLNFELLEYVRNDFEVIALLSRS